MMQPRFLERSYAPRFHDCAQMLLEILALAAQMLLALAAQMFLALVALVFHFCLHFSPTHL